MGIDVHIRAVIGICIDPNVLFDAKQVIVSCTHGRDRPETIPADAKFCPSCGTALRWAGTYTQNELGKVLLRAGYEGDVYGLADEAKPDLHSFQLVNLKLSESAPDFWVYGVYLREAWVDECDGSAQIVILPSFVAECAAKVNAFVHQYIPSAASATLFIRPYVSC